MQLSVFALRDLIHGVSRTRHFKRGLHVLRGSHAAFPRRVWAAGSFQCRLFVPLRWAGSLMALLCIHLRLQRHKCMFYLCHPLCTLFFFSAAPSVRVAPLGKPILPRHTPCASCMSRVFFFTDGACELVILSVGMEGPGGCFLVCRDEFSDGFGKEGWEDTQSCFWVQPCPDSVEPSLCT